MRYRKKQEEQEIGELNIVPYLDIVTNLVMFMLLSMVGLISLGVIDVSTPQITRKAGASEAQSGEQQLGLTVGIAKKGFYIYMTGRLIGEEAAPGQEEQAQSQPTVPLRGADYDYAGLTEKVLQIKDKFPKEEKVILAAEPDIPYDIIIRTMDACREKITTGADGIPEKKVLFPFVWLSAMR